MSKSYLLDNLCSHADLFANLHRLATRTLSGHNMNEMEAWDKLLDIALNTTELLKQFSEATGETRPGNGIASTNWSIIHDGHVNWPITYHSWLGRGSGLRNNQSSLGFECGKSCGGKVQQSVWPPQNILTACHYFTHFTSFGKHLSAFRMSNLQQCSSNILCIHTYLSQVIGAFYLKQNN